MYIGRFVILGKTAEGGWFVGYRVSSRSFPNRRIVAQKDRAVVLPTPDAPPSDNPYISYNCLRTRGNIVVAGNGSQVDPIMDKVSIGYPLRDAIALSLLALDYEHDQYNTPRVVAALDGQAGMGYLAIVAADKLYAKQMILAPGQACLAATYELTEPTPIHLAGDSADELCNAIFDCEYELPVAALAALQANGELQMATRSAR